MIRIILFLVSLSSLCPCYALTCNVACAGLNFGSYTSQTPGATTTSGTISVTCQASIAGLLINYSVAASAGSGSYVTRTMQNGSNNLNYNLYLDPGLTTVFGDGSASTSNYTGTILLTILNIPVMQNRTIYASIPGGQTVLTGVYTDTLTLTVTF